MFDIEGTDVAALTDADLRTLVARLAIAELDANGLPVSGVTAGGSQDAADGGLDVRVEVANLPSPDFVPRGITGFQVKKPNMTAAAIAGEMAPAGMLRPVIGELADAGGSYIIVSAQGSVADGPLTARRRAMRDAVTGHPNASALHVDFYDRDRMATWVNRYPGVAAWVRVRVGRELKGWRAIGDWTDGSVAGGSPYLSDGHACLIDERSKEREGIPIEVGIARLREALSQPRQAVRLIGLSGLGKTRLVQALFETGVGGTALDPASAIYTDYSDETSPSAREMARRLVDTDRRAILIVDNCNPATHAELVRICAGKSGRVSLITVEYDVRGDEPERTDVFRLVNASPSLVEAWLETSSDHLSQVDRMRIAVLSDGNFRVARTLAGTVVRGETLGQLRDRDLFERIFRQRNVHDQGLQLAAEDLSLLYSFDGEDTSGGGELARIGGIRGVSPSALYGYAADLRGRGVVQSRGRWRAILPQVIANPLAGYALKRIPPDDYDRFCALLPMRMLKSVSRRLGYLHDHAEAGRAVARWLRADGPLGGLFQLGEDGIEIVANIAPVAPEIVLARIEAEIAGGDGQSILAPKNKMRGRWVSLIKMLAYDPAMFEDAVFALARFVAAEPEGHNQNSAVRDFGELFQLHLSGTQAPPGLRRDVIRRLAESGDAGIRACVAHAIGSLLEATHFASLSRHDFGARPRDFGWRPQFNREVGEWFNAGIALAVELGARVPEMRDVLGRKIHGLWCHAASQDALEAASVELSRGGTWLGGFFGFRRVLLYHGVGMPEDQLWRLRSIIARLEPVGLLDRARASVFNRSDGGFDLPEGGTADPATAWRLAGQQAVDLGKVFAIESAALKVFLPELFSERTAHRAFEFGTGLAEGADDVASLWSSLLAAFRDVPADHRNAVALGGFIHGATADRAFVDAALDGVAGDAELVRYLTYLQARAGIDLDGMVRVTAALAAKTIGVDDFRHLASGAVRGAPGDALAVMLAGLAKRRGGSAVALDILHMHFLCAKDDGFEDDPNLIRCGRDLLATAEFDNDAPLDDYAAGEVIVVCLAGPDGEESARRLCGRIRDRIDGYRLSSYNIVHVLKSVFTVQPMIALDCLLLAKGDDHRDAEFRLSHWSPFEGMEAALLRRWADGDAETRYPLIGGVLSMFEKSEIGDAVGLSKLFVGLLETAPDRAAFLGSQSRIIPNGWSGSLADVLERQRIMLGPLADHADAAVRDWMRTLDVWLIGYIAEERLRNAASEESFE